MHFDQLFKMLFKITLRQITFMSRETARWKVGILESTENTV